MKSIDSNLFRIFGRIAFISVILVLVSAGMASAVTNVSSCGTTIDISGTYLLNTSISNYSSGTCITITVSDVIFDGQGYTIDGVDAYPTQGIHVNSSTSLTNVTVKNVTVTDWYEGIKYDNASNGSITDNTANSNGRGIIIEYSSNNTNITNNTANSNDVRGIWVLSSSNNNVKDNNASSNVYDGILIETSSNNTVANNTVSSNDYEGIVLSEDGNNNIVANNTVSSNTNYGIRHWSSGNNTIYNNFFNNTNNSFFESTIYSNDWNTTKTAGINIVGPYLGGNFWAKPDGTGFSETCSDTDADGICDLGYTLASGNMDYLPLSLNFAPPTTTTTTVAMTPMMLKNDTITELEAAKTGDKKTDKEIDKAIRHILKSLNIDPKHPDRPRKKYPLWIDETHLDPKHGHKVFNEEKKAVKKLIKLCKSESGACPFDDVINKLIQADEVLAKTAINDAKNISIVDPKNQDKVDKEIAKAEKELAKAEDKLNEGKPDKAIDHYKKAWKHAQHAIKHAEKIKKEK